MEEKEYESECSFAPTKATNADRGPTDAQPTESPLERSMRQAIEARVGKATSPQTGLSS